MNVSIITINYNNKEGLRKTIRSVIEQDYESFEFIIIDGGSTDGSLDVIQEYREHIDYWVSEPDQGIYNAMNKGVKVAKGEFCNFMNSGDIFSDNYVLKNIFLSDNISYDIICGNTFITNWVKAPDIITMDFLFHKTICHQCAFIRLELLLKHNYDESLKIVSDRKFFIQSLIFDNCSYKSVDVNVVIYDLTGFSSRNRVLSDLEYDKVLKDILPERIRYDYGKKNKGLLYGDSYYEKLFYEIGLRNYRKIIYTIVVIILRFMYLFRKSASFVKFFPLRIKKNE